MPQITSRPLAPRLPGLDLIRAVAIAWVMLYHGSLFGLTSQDNWLVRFGWMGVDLFFVLSGFLIAGQLLRPWARGLKPSYSRFFGRRLLRTTPAYLTVVTLYFLIPYIRDRPQVQPLWQFLTFTENLFVDISTPKAFSHVWSLCVEEQFYVIFPAVVALIAVRPSETKVICALASVLLLGMVARGYIWLHLVSSVPFDADAQPQPRAYMELIYYPTWTRLDGLLMGVTAALVQTFRPMTWNRITSRPNMVLIAGLIGVIASTFLFGGEVAGFRASIFGYPLLSLSISMLVMAGTSSKSLIGRYKVPGAAALATGACSLYLSHKAVFHIAQMWSDHLLEQQQWMMFPLALSAALCVGAVLYWAVERPFLRLRDRLEGPSRSSLALPRTDQNSWRDAPI